jgi:hypothetical protein
MPKPPLPSNLPLRVRGIKGVAFMSVITPLAPLILRGDLGRASWNPKDKTQVTKAQEPVVRGQEPVVSNQQSGSSPLLPGRQ